MSSVSVAAGSRVLLIAPHGSYRTAPFLDAGKSLGIDVVVVSDGRHSVVSAYANGLHVDLSDLPQACRILARYAQLRPVQGVIGTDDASTQLAARIAQQLGLVHNDPESAQIARRKDLARQRLASAKVPIPDFRRLDLSRDLPSQCKSVAYPCVVKPLAMSASRGVIRANNETELLRACGRVKKLIRNENSAEEARYVLVEDFISGREVALEGLLQGGRLQVLALFDKPEPLNGPFFEETYYVTPSRLSRNARQQVREAVSRACQAYGLLEGPIHAECRLNEDGVWIIEIASRTIGGLCGRLFQQGTGHSLEHVVLLHAVGLTTAVQAQSGAAGVLMVPAGTGGVLRRVEGVLAAERVKYIDEVRIDIRTGYRIVPWPEGDTYPGFIFARAPSARLVEQALREALAQLKLVTMPEFPVRLAS